MAIKLSEYGQGIANKENSKAIVGRKNIDLANLRKGDLELLHSIGSDLVEGEPEPDPAAAKAAQAAEEKKKEEAAAAAKAAQENKTTGPPKVPKK